ncbi:hypothetical protein EDC04DRAFT_2786933, partial [Pisolithus marmoratus]
LPACNIPPTIIPLLTTLLACGCNCIGNPAQPPLMTMTTMMLLGMMASSCAGVTSLPLCRTHNSQCIYCPVPLPTTCH